MKKLFSTLLIGLYLNVIHYILIAQNFPYTYSTPVPSSAGLSYPFAVAVDGAGNTFVTDSGNCIIRQITPTGSLITVAGSGSAGSQDGTGSAASFNSPEGIAVDRAGHIYVADTYSHTIRIIDKAGRVTTLAGTAGVQGGNDGSGASASFNYPTGIAVDSGGNNIYVADCVNSTIRVISGYGVVTTLAGYQGNNGSVDDIGSNARFYNPLSLALDSVGNIYVTDSNNSTIRKISPSGMVSTFAGSAGQKGHLDATGVAARFITPAGIAVDGAGNIYVTDVGDSTIRKITPSGGGTTIGGNGTLSSGDGVGTSAGFNNPYGIGVGASGAIYIGDTYNNSIRLGSLIPPTITLSVPSGQNRAAIYASGFSLNVTLTNAVNYRIQGSSDFQAWTDLAHIVGTTGTVAYSDLLSTTNTARYYRVVTP